MVFDNSTTFLLSPLSENVNLIIPIVTAIIGAVLGYFVSGHYQKSNNLREKTREIDKIVFSELRSWANINLRFLERRTIFDINQSSFRLSDMIRCDNIERILSKSDIYERKENFFVLSYKKNRILNKYSPKIINYSKEYCINFTELEKIVNAIDFEKYYGPLKSDLIDIKCNIVEATIPNLNNELKRVILSILFDNCDLFPNGNRTRLDSLKNRYEEIKQIVFKNQELKEDGERIAIILNNLIINTEGLNKELTNLHNDWRDKYHI
jgi:hypothetical protein